MGRFRPFVTVCDFSALVTCYAVPNAGFDQKLTVRPPLFASSGIYISIGGELRVG